jgi:predicted molibdopterin-dependent oxidoreductase YjgC
MKIVMNGREVAAMEGQTILQVARANGVDIPTLCYVAALDAAAMCRLCTVELTEGRRTKLVTACNYPLRHDAEIQTHTESLRKGRRMLIELLAARCPDSVRLRELAAEYGANLERFPVSNQDCVMCGLCARVCERVGGRTLTLSGRGADIHVDTAFNRPSELCIGCGACAQICPVNKIQIVDENGLRRVIVRGQEAARIFLNKCTGCGQYFGPVIDLAEVMDRLGEARVPAPNVSVCPDCSRRSLATRLAQRHFEQYEQAPETAEEV